MSTLVAKPAPNFKAQAVMPDGSFKEIELSDYRGKYVILFFYPLDFTFVCPTEIIAFSTQIKDFQSRNTEVLGVSVDSHFSHLAWRNTDRKVGGLGQIDYALVADLDKKISEDYGVLADGGIGLLTVCGLWLSPYIVPEHNLEHNGSLLVAEKWSIAGIA